MDNLDLKFMIDSGQKHKNWEHFDYHFMPLGDYSRNDEIMIYNWCMENLNSIGGWQVLWYGIVIQNADDAILFKMTWC